MRFLKENFIKIYKTERSTIVLMALNFLLSIGLIVFFSLNVKSGTSILKVGYGDIDGYRDGSLIDLLIFPILAIIFGILHNLLAIRIYAKRGGGMAKLFLLLTTTLIMGAALTLSRLIGRS